MEVRRYISCFRCLLRNARCNTMSHLTADAVFVHLSRETPDVTPCHTSPPQGVPINPARTGEGAAPGQRDAPVAGLKPAARLPGSGPGRRGGIPRSGVHTGVCEKNNPFARAFALQHGSRTANQPSIWCLLSELSPGYSSLEQCSFHRHR